MNGLEFKTLKSLEVYLRKLVEKKLWLKVLISMFGGILFGYFLRPEFGIIPENYSQNIGSWLILPGQLFLKLVQMIMIPLLFSSIITGLVSNTNENLKKLGLKVGMYFIFTTAFSVTLGVILTYFFKPGKLLGFRASPTSISNESNIDIDLPSMISNILPDNPLASMVSGEMLSIVIFTIIIGIAITQLKTATKSPVMRLLSAIQEICMTIVKWSMNLVPIAVFGFLANLVSTIGFASLKGVGLYIATVLVALFILLVFYLLIVLILGKRNPFVFLRDIRDVQLLAFSTTSSAAVMPLSIKTAQEKLKISPSVSNFLIPIGATINMDGTAVYQCISTIFIAQAYAIDLNLSNLIVIILSIIAGSIGTPAIPGGGMIILASVLQSVGIPTEGIVIIIGVERILGMFRTSINVTGDLAACTVFDNISTDVNNPD